MLRLRSRQGYFKNSECYAWLIVSFFIATAIAMRVNEYATFMQWDGIRHLLNTKEQFFWGGPVFSNGFDFTKGLVELSYPTLYRLDPAIAIAYWAGDGEMIRWLAITLLALIFFGAVLIAGRSFGFSISVSALAGCMACWLVEPYVAPALGQLRLWGNPVFLTPLAASLVAIALFWQIGKGRLRRIRNSIFAAMVIGAIVTAMGIAQPLVLLMVAPMSSLLVLGGIAYSGDREERKTKLLTCAAVLIATAPILLYVVELHLYSKTSFFYDEMHSSAPLWTDISFFLAPGDKQLLGPAFWFASLGAIVWAALFSSGRLLQLARTVLATELLLAMLLGIAIVTGTAWAGPPVAYLELILFPFQALFLADALVQIGHRLSALTPYQTGLRRTTFLLVPWLGAVPVLAAGGAWQDSGNLYWKWPPTETRLSALLRQEIGLHDNQTFRGRVVSLSASKSTTTPLIDQFIYDNGFIAALGNDQRRYGFWAFDIPTLESSGQFTTPFLHLIATRLLGTPGATSFRAHVSLTRANIPILQALGVRFVVSDDVMTNSGLRERDVIDEVGRVLRVYELPNPNVGQYSPTEVLQAADAKQALHYMSGADFNPQKFVVLHQPLSTALVPATSQGLRFERQRTLSVEATSAGTSLLLLPVEFTSCLRIENHSQGSDIRLVRANLAETGIVFDGKLNARLSLRFGPFALGCRMQDWLEARRLRMQHAATGGKP